jgi:hypothetical protein
MPIDSVFCFGAAAGILLTVLIFLPILLRHRPKTPDCPTEKDWKITISNMTRRKAMGLLGDRPENRVEGFVVAFPGAQRVALVYQSGVRWLEPAEMWEVMHPTPADVAAHQAVMAAAQAANLVHLTTPVPEGVDSLDHVATLLEENNPEYWYQLRFDFLKIRSVADTIEDLKELSGLTAQQKECVDRAAIWLSGLSEVNDAWWQDFIKYVDTLTTQPEHEQTRESLIELVSRVIAHPADAM